MTVSGDSIKLYRTAAQLTQPVTPAKHPPTGLKLVRDTEIGNHCNSICHHKGYTYVGLSGGTVKRLDHQGKKEKKIYTSANNISSLESLAAHKDRLFLIDSSKQSTKVLVLGLKDGRLLTSWKVPQYG